MGKSHTTLAHLSTLGTKMTPRATPAFAVLATIVVALVVAVGLATPASAQAKTKVFTPVDKTRHALVYRPRAVSIASVRSARVRLHNRRTDTRRVRRVPEWKVRKALRQGSRMRVYRGRREHGPLKFEVGAPADRPPPDVEPPAPGTIPSDWRRFASFESTLNEGSDFGWRADSPFSVSRTDEAGAGDGNYAAKIVTHGGNSGCSCPRMTFEDGFSSGPGEEVWVSGSWRIANPEKLAWSRLMNLGHFGSGTNWYLALESTSAGTFQVGYAAYSNPHVAVLPARPIPADRWFRVDLHFVLSPTDGQALTEWFIDGELVGTTTKANMLNSSPLHFFNAGLPYFSPSNGNTTVYFDAPALNS